MEEMHRTRYGERVWSYHALSRCSTLPEVSMCSPTWKPGSQLIFDKDARQSYGESCLSTNVSGTIRYTNAKKKKKKKEGKAAAAAQSISHTLCKI